MRAAGPWFRKGHASMVSLSCKLLQSEEVRGGMELPEVISERGWDFLCPHIRPERAEKIALYAAQYLEPAFAGFPELFGKVYLSLRKYGWLAEYKPVLYIVIRESALEIDSPWRIRATTAHELMHLVQFSHGIGLNRYGSRDVERQATFLTFARGFAYDFLRAFPASCPNTPCDHGHKLCYFGCGLLFNGCCRDCTEDELRVKASGLTALAQRYSLHDSPDYFKLVSGCLHTDELNQFAKSNMLFNQAIPG